MGQVTCGPRLYTLYDVTNYDGVTGEGQRFEVGALTDHKYVQIHQLLENQVQMVIGTNSTSDSGLHLIELEVMLENYPTIKATSVFDVTFYAQEANLTMPIIEYELGSGPLEITIP